MKDFAALLDRLAFEPAREAKIRLLTDAFRQMPDPARGYVLAALTGGLALSHLKPQILRELAAARTDPELFALSYDYVGDLAETVALIWPVRPGANAPAPSLEEVIAAAERLPKGEVAAVLGGWLDGLDAAGRWALCKLITGGLRVGVSARLAKTALAAIGGREPQALDDLWHGLAPPYTDLFAWLEGRGPRPETAARAPFRPVMLAHGLEEGEAAFCPPMLFAAEWKWDGVRVQAVSDQGTVRLYSRTGEDMSKAFPDLLDALPADCVLDGELLIHAGGKIEPFGRLQQRLNRKTVSKAQMAENPAHLRAYDLLIAGGEDLRALPFRDRRARLEALLAGRDDPRLSLSPLVPFLGAEELAALRASPPDPAIEGLMLKAWDSPYLPGRVKGHWYKWKRAPGSIDAVLMYAQRGHGKRSGFYSDFTFGLRKGDAIVPVGKAYSGFSDADLKRLDKYVRDHAGERFGPVRVVAHGLDQGLVLEVAFDGVSRSGRHKSGVALRFPRIQRIRWDKPAAEADGIEALEKLLPPERT